MTTLDATPAAGYPIRALFAPPGKQSRLSVFFRILIAIPAFIVLAFVAIAAAVVTFVAWFIILITGRFPSGMFRFCAGAHRWSLRVTAYLYLLTDKYPPFSLSDDLNYPVRFLAADAVDGRNRLTVFFRLILAIPHMIIVSLLSYAARAIGFVCWLVAIFSGTVPEGLHNFLAGYLRWSIRAQAYEGLITDRYPPFNMSDTA
ncbi:MAG TPA: DUF4389 domain-containing protein [Tepidiformaceae bacterium]|nr:DUF4389 domain-containing protein [Tepidiformaceae bacterium]